MNSSWNVQSQCFISFNLVFTQREFRFHCREVNAGFMVVIRYLILNALVNSPTDWIAFALNAACIGRHDSAKQAKAASEACHKLLPWRRWSKSSWHGYWDKISLQPQDVSFPRP